MKVVSDSSPLITLAKIGTIELLPKLYRTIIISSQVYREVVVTGAGLAGSSEISKAKWIQVQPVELSSLSAAARQRSGIGEGELSTIVLARRLKAERVLIDDMRARRVAQREGMAVLGCIGVLEDAFNMKLLSDLRGVYLRLLASGAYVERKILEASLEGLGLPPL